MNVFMSCFDVRNCAVTLVTALCFVSSHAHSQTGALATSAGANFVAVGEKPAIVYDAPSQKGNRTFVLSRFHPLEVLVRLDKWTKFRDAEGTIGWVENSVLGDRRFVQVSVSVAEVRATPAMSAQLVFEAQRGVLLETTGTTVDGWIPVRHRDGQAGVVRTIQVWGG